MQHRTKPLALIGAIGLLFFTICACSAGGSSPAVGTATSGTQATKTPAAPPCATTASTTAEAWIDMPAGHQVSGSIGGAAATQLSNFVYPLGLPGETSIDMTELSDVALSPEGHHLAVNALLGFHDTVDGFPYLVDTTTHAVTQIPVTNDPFPDAAAEGTSLGLTRRLLIWADNHTLIILSGRLYDPAAGLPASNAQSFDINTSTLTTLPGITSPIEGVVRCSTLFWLSISKSTMLNNGAEPPQYSGTVALNRYNLSTHAAIGAPIPMGDYRADAGCACGQVFNLPGWDVSLDGSHIAYQQIAVAVPSGNITSQFFAANADGSGAIQILHGATPGAVATSNTGTNLSISPNGKQVAVTYAQPTPDIVSGSMSGGDAKPYTPDAIGIPAWLHDSSGFDVDTTTPTYAVNSFTVMRYLLSTPGEPGDGRAPATSTIATNASTVVSIP